jgi:outer membrane protein OmpA-like peptidoglycan-associated protein
LRFLRSLNAQQNRGLLRGEMPCFPPLTSTDYTPRDIKIFFKNSRFQTRGVYTTPFLPWQDSSLMNQLQKQGVQVQATDKLKVIIRVDTLFKFPSSTQLQNSKNEVLSEVATLIENYGDHVVTISGHTDNVGSDEEKLKRSRDQANAVAAYLWSRGIPLKNMIVLACGDTKPVADNVTTEGSAANRRIEISI